MLLIYEVILFFDFWFMFNYFSLQILEHVFFIEMAIDIPIAIYIDFLEKFL